MDIVPNSRSIPTFGYWIQNPAVRGGGGETIRELWRHEPAHIGAAENGFMGALQDLFTTFGEGEGAHIVVNEDMQRRTRDLGDMTGQVGRKVRMSRKITENDRRRWVGGRYLAGEQTKTDPAECGRMIPKWWPPPTTMAEFMHLPTGCPRFTIVSAIVGEYLNRPAFRGETPKMP
jgi:hypothetical protein